MMRILIAPTFLLTLCAAAQTPPAIEWQTCLGGTGVEVLGSIRQTTDGGVVIAGSTNSNNGDVTGFHGGEYDIWVVKLDADGGMQWQKALGGSGYDGGYDIQQTTDGGYIVTGGSASNNGNVSGNHGADDFWVVKLDPAGAIEWQRSLGGSGGEGSYAVQQTTDGGYLLAGTSVSVDGDVTGNNGFEDIWVVRLDPQGTILWQRSLGGSSFDNAYALDLTTDGGCIVAGTTSSNDGDVTGNHGGNDWWIVKLDAAGSLQWQRCFGGTDSETAYAVKQTSEGGYIAAGSTQSSNGDITGHHGGRDLWLTKQDANGDLQWQRAVGGSATEGAGDVLQTADGGSVVVGSTDSNDGDVMGSPVQSDGWLVRFNAEGSLLWQLLLGGTGVDAIPSVARMSDGGYALGISTSSNDGDVGCSHGDWDIWIVRLAVDPTGLDEIAPPRIVAIYPNPAYDTITLELAVDPTTPVSYRWCDASGRVLSSGMFAQSSFVGTTITLSMVDMALGAYTLWVKAGERTMAVPVVKL